MEMRCSGYVRASCSLLPCSSGFTRNSELLEWARLFLSVLKLNFRCTTSLFLWILNACKQASKWFWPGCRGDSCISYLESDFGRRLIREGTALAATLQTFQLPYFGFVVSFFKKCYKNGLCFFCLSVPSLSGLVRLKVKTSFFFCSVV